MAVPTYADYQVPAIGSQHLGAGEVSGKANGGRKRENCVKLGESLCMELARMILHTRKLPAIVPIFLCSLYVSLTGHNFVT